MDFNFIPKKNVHLKGVLFSSVAMAFAGLGDALLYSVLPIYGDQMGYSTLWIGIFLSINRFVRIPGNWLVAKMIAKNGYRNAMLIATWIATLTTAFYGVKIGVALFLVTRIAWGVAYSTMRVSSLTYAAETVKNKHLMFGLVQSIKTMGAVVALALGAWLITLFNVKTTFFVLGSLSFFAVFFSYRLPRTSTDSAVTKFKHIFEYSPVNLLTFSASFMIDGVLVVIISKLFVSQTAEDLITLVSGYLLFRKLSAVLLSPIAGWLSDRFGIQRVFRVALSFVLVGISFLTFDMIEVGVILAFLFNSIVVALLPSVAILFSDTNKLSALTAVTTWWDIGAASGTLVGLVLLELAGHQWLFGLFLLLLSFVSRRFVFSSKGFVS